MEYLDETLEICIGDKDSMSGTRMLFSFISFINTLLQKDLTVLVLLLLLI